MRSDLLKAIAGSKDVTNAIILTHNIDFVFLQTLALAAFRKCGHPTITVFADAQCAAESFAHQAPVLDGLGVRYRVVPVAMAPGFRFHPKAVLLSGEKDGTLFVGSGNLTFGGWRENAEVWMRFDSATDGPSVFTEFRRYTDKILARVPLPDAVSAELAEAFDPKTRRWFSGDDSANPATLLGRAGDGPALLDAMLAALGGGVVDELVICSPYFDAEGAAVRALLEQTKASRATVLCQPSGSTLTRQGFDGIRERARVEQVSYEHVSSDGKPRTAFIHAKFYGFLQGDQAMVFAGSANCSRAALTIGAAYGNAELLAMRRMPVAEFESAWVGELQRIPTPVTLGERAAGDEDVPTANLRVLAARFESGSLLVAFAPPRAEILSCEVDGAEVRYSVAEAGIISVTCSTEPRAVRLEADLDGVVVRSQPGWVDHETYLRASARGRSLADSIRARMQPGGWNAAAWADVMDVFCKHLTYLPIREGSRALPRADGQDSAGAGSFSFGDVFSSEYRVPTLGGLGELMVKLESGKERSLQQLLLRWFGVVDEPNDSTADEMTETDDGSDEVDRPDVVHGAPKHEGIASVTDADRRRIQKILPQVEAAMTERRPELLAADLKVAAVLLRTGLREGWIDANEFFRVTHRIWMALFFCGSPQAEQGWLEYRLRTSGDPSAFGEAIRSPELAAALLGWALAAAPDVSSPESARFHLAAALAVARLPWLWDAGDESAVGRELEVLLAHTGTSDGRNDVARIRAAWERMLRRGHALLRLEEAVRNITMRELRSRIRCADLHAGKLLWQGAAGYCVVTKRTPRVEGKKVPVLRLQGSPEESHFAAPFTVPILALLDEAVIPASPGFGEEPRRELREFLGELEKGLDQLVANAGERVIVKEERPRDT